MKKYTVDIHTSTVADGNMAVRFGDSDAVDNNRQQFLARCGATSSIALMEVSHGDVIRDVSHEAFGGVHELSMEAEALVTKDEDVTLFLLTGDCIPVVFFDHVQGVVALAHLGWRPTVLGLIEKTIRHVETVYGTDSRNLEVFLGPSIQAPSYAFPEVTQHDSAWEPYLKKDTDGLIHVDLPGYVKGQCVRLGIPDSSPKSLIFSLSV